MRLRRSQPSPEPSTSQAVAEDWSMCSDDENDSGEPNALPAARVQEMAQPVLKYILNATGGKLAIKRADLIRQCLRGNTGAFDAVMQHVKQWLDEIYGYELVEVKTPKIHIFLCITNFAGYSCSHLTEEQHRHATLMFLVLSYIYMKRNAVLEGPLFAFLKKLGIDEDDSQENGPFGDVRKLITETYVRQMYLKREKVMLECSSGHEERFQYEWGIRALREFKPKSILDCVAKVMERPAITFQRQYAELYGHTAEDGGDDNNDDEQMDSS